VLSYYGLDKRPRRRRISPSWQKLEATIANHFRRLQLSRLFQFASERGIEPSAVPDGFAEEFLEALRPSVRQAERSWRHAINAWNKEVQINRHWPKLLLSPPKRRKIWGLRWSEFPKSLEQEVRAFFDPDSDRVGLFDVVRAPLAASTIVAQKQCLRLAASAHVRAGADPRSLTGLRELCAPEAFQRAIKCAVARGFGGPRHQR
jgi:hypothetical protein